MASTPPPSTDAPELPDAPPPTATRRWPLVAAALVLAAAVTVPLVVSRWPGGPSGGASVASAEMRLDSMAAAASVPGAQRVVLDVSGMFCTSCERTVMAMLTRTPGVVGAEVSVARREAIILYDPARTTPAALITVVKGLGYRAAVRPA